MERPTLKERWLKRFDEARSKLGPNWRKELAKHNAEFNTQEAYHILTNVAGAMSRPKSAGVERIAWVVEAMESILNEPQPAEV